MLRVPASRKRAMGRITLAVCRTELVGGGDLVFKLRIDFVEADVGGAAGGEAAVGIEGDAVGREVFQGGFDTGDDGFGGVDLAGLAAYAAEADLDVLGKFFEDGHVTGAG